jgi:hypothetical protein
MTNATPDFANLISVTEVSPKFSMAPSRHHT